jgi:asparagine synthetase B (glutamine-hydrolysing)
LRALCWSAPELPEADESQYSAEVCRFLDIPITELRADLLWPLSRPEGIHTTALMPFYGYYSELLDETFRLARSLGSPVVFSGMSGDHLFGGNIFAYPDLLLTGRWLELARQIRYHQPRSSMRLSLSQILRRMLLSPILQAYLHGLRRSVAPAMNWLRPPYDQLYHDHFTRPPEVRWLLPGRLERYRSLSHPKLPRFVEAMNRQAENQGVEFRHPLMDHRLIEFAASLPTDQTFRASQRKIIVRNAMRGLLPSSVLEMWDKILPTAIMHRGLREREQAKVLHLMTDMRAADLGFIDPAKLRQAYQDYLSGKTDSTLFWHTLTLEDWLRRWF